MAKPIVPAKKFLGLGKVAVVVEHSVDSSRKRRCHCIIDIVGVPEGDWYIEGLMHHHTNSWSGRIAR
ncbi:MAG: hypothetical protein AAGJ35_15055 [Myxococcota bacterium]